QGRVVFKFHMVVLTKARNVILLLNDVQIIILGIDSAFTTYLLLYIQIFSKSISDITEIKCGTPGHGVWNELRQGFKSVSMYAR
ncbi:hypothetical protein ACJX0J_040809, partial [Zea mays]